MACNGVHAETIDRSLAIADSQTLRELDIGQPSDEAGSRGFGFGLGLGRMLRVARSSNEPISGAELFALPALAPVKAALDNELARYAARTRTSASNTTGRQRASARHAGIRP